MADLYKNIVYPGASITAGGNVHIGDVFYNFFEDFRHSILFLSIEKNPVGGSGEFSAQLSVKSRHARQGRLGTSGEGLLREKITLDIPPQLFQQAAEFQETRRHTDTPFRFPGAAETAAAARIGEERLSQALFDAFFSGDIGTVCRDFIALLEKRKVEELLLVISADGAEVKNLPWEMALPHFFRSPLQGAGGNSLAVSHFGIARTLEADLAAFDLTGKTASPAPLKMLFVTALPENLPEKDKMLQIEHEQNLLIEAVGSLEATGDSQPKIVVEFLDNASLEAIDSALAARRHDILHVSGHGAWFAEAQQGVLFLENEWGDELKITGAQLGETLRRHQCLKLVLLSACETSICGSDDSSLTTHDSSLIPHPSSLKSGVVEQLAPASGVPAIVAMRFAVTDDGAKRFTSVLYERLAKGETLTCSLAEAREALWSEVQEKRRKEPLRRHIAEWFTPVVWQNQHVGALADLRQPYALPGDFYPRSSFVKSRQTRLLGQGFIGRKSYRIRLRRLFSEGKHACLHGLGGMGKTTLAEAFAHSFDNRSHEFIPFSGSAKINEKFILDKLLERFPPTAAHVLQELKVRMDGDEEPTEKLQLLLDNCLAGRKCILLFDNFEDVQVSPNSSSAKSSAELEFGGTAHAIASPGLRSFLIHLCENAPPGCHLLFTTRYKIADLGAALTHLPLDKMSYAEQYRLTNFSEHLRRIPMQQRESVWRRLDGHPRAYEFLESLLKKDASFDWSALDASVGQVEARVFENLLLEKVWLRLTAEEQAVFCFASIFIARTSLTALEYVFGKNEPAKRSWWQKLTGKGSGIASKINLSKVIQSLHGWSVCFVEEGGGFEVHRLTREWVLKNKLTQQERKGWALKAGEFYEKQRQVESDDLAVAYFDIAEAWEPFADASFRLQGIYVRIGFNQKVRELNENVLAKNISPARNGRALNYIGYLLLKTGDYDAALEYFQQSLKIRQEIRDRHGEGATLNNIGQIHDAKGDYDTALKYLQQSLKITEEIGDRKGEGATLNNISQIHDAKGDYDTALKYLQQSLKIMQEIGDRHGKGAILNNISQIHKVKGDYDTALKYLQQSLKIMQEIGDFYGMADALHNMGAMLFEQGRLEEAVPLLAKAQIIFQKIGSPNVRHPASLLNAIIQKIGKARFQQIIQNK